MRIQSFDSFKFREVFKITQWKDGMIFKTKTTNCFVREEDVEKLDKLKWTTASLSTSLTRQPEIEIDVRSPEEFT